MALAGYLCPVGVTTGTRCQDWKICSPIQPHNSQRVIVASRQVAYVKKILTNNYT